MERERNSTEDLFAVDAKRQSTVDLVIDTIKNLLINNKLKPGDLLPSENSLAESIQVSRGSIREAMKILAAFGIVEIKRGDGTYIATSANKRIFDPLIFSLIFTNTDSEELIQLREMMEVGVIDMIIKNASEENIDQLKAAYRKMEETINSGEQDIEVLNRYDINFHRIMAKITRNHLVENMYNFVIDIFAPTINARFGLNEHKKILDAIIARNRDEAAVHEHEHIEVWRQARKMK